MTELEKLKNTAAVIYDLTEGRIQMRPSGLGHICIHAAEDAYINLNMELKSNLEQKCYDISFSSFVRRMGSTMNSRDLGMLYREVHQAQALLTALEMYSFQPTQKDMERFHDHQVEQNHSPSQLEQASGGVDTQTM